MNKVTRIAYSKNLNQGKVKQLSEIAKRLGKIRKEVWHRYGSVSGVGLTDRKIRDLWLREGRKFSVLSAALLRGSEDSIINSPLIGLQTKVPARLWKETLRDTFDSILLYRSAAKAKVRKAIAIRTFVGSATQGKSGFYPKFP